MNQNITVELPDGSKKKFPQGVTAGEIAASIGPRLAKDALGAKVNEEIKDLQTPILSDSKIKILTEKDKETLEILRHSTTHIMAQAVKRLYKDQVEITIGPVIENGYFYDFSFKKEFSVTELSKIEKEMEKIIKENFPIKRREIYKKEAISFFKKQKELYKVKIIEELLEDKVSVYDQGDFTDLCRGPHMPSTGRIKAFKLLSIAGAYWRGSEKNEMLTRIYGTAFFSKIEQDEYIHLLEEAKKRDHRKIGKELDLFSFHPESPASPFFHEKGVILYEQLLKYCRRILDNGDYKLVKTPLIYTDELWRQSGHYENYRENMFFTEHDGQQMAVKPMNCPGHVLIYKDSKHSYRELPLRIAEFGHVHRYEKSGVLHGLFRVRSFSQDDAHIFCMENQIEEEVTRLIGIILKTYRDFQFKEFKIELSTRPEKAMGSQAAWDKATQALENALKKSKVEFKLNPGAGAFYGPKIDFHIKDSLGRYWQCGTIQLDFSMPERFDILYTGADGAAHRPVMVHRAIIGSPERFLGVLIEHFGGRFPLWLAPTQVAILNLTDAQVSYTEEVFQHLREGGLRVVKDTRNEKLGFKIREAELKKIPYMLIVGDKEVSSKTLTVRKWGEKEQSTMGIEDFVKKTVKEAGLPN